MLLVFKSKPAAKVVMFSQHALPVLQAAGRPYVDTVPERGVFTHDQLAQAIAGIERAVSADVAPVFPVNSDENDIKEHPITEPVSFRQRAYPLLDMLRVSLAHNADVTWEPATTW